MTIAVPYSWLKQVPASLLKKEEVPVFGYSPPFPWTELAEQVGKSLQLRDLTIAPREWQIRSEQELLQGLGKAPFIQCIELAPLLGAAWFVMPENEIERLISYLLTKKDETTNLIAPEYRRGLIEFIALELSNGFRNMEYGREFSPTLGSAELNSHQPTSLYCQEISITLDALPFTARMIFSEELRHAWQQRFSERTVNNHISIVLAEKLSLILHLEAGRSFPLSRQEWSDIQIGDFLLLAQASIDPSKDKGRVMLTLDGRPLYRARLKDGNIKILEFPLYHEVESTMATTHDADKFDESGEFDYEPEESYAEGMEDSFLEEADESFAEGITATESEAETSQEETASTKGEANTPEVSEEPPAAPKPISVADLPITVVVEVGRLQMTVRKLLELQTGDLLELDLDPDNAVDLVVNGNVIGKGELLKIGETLGVRILDKL